nr:hypothetical protein [Tanacetum cinerariifolium]
MDEINNFQQEPDENPYQAWERFKELLMKSTRARSTEKSNGLVAIQAQLNNLGREIKKVNEKVYVVQVGCEQCKGPHYTKDCPLKEEGKTLEEAYYTQFSRPFQGGGYRAAALRFYQRNNVNPCRLNGYYCKEKKGSYGPKFFEAYSEASHIDNSIPRKEKDPGSFTLPCFINNVCFDNALVDLGANVSVMPLSTYLNLGLGELVHTKLTVELADRTMKYPKGIAQNVLVGIGKFVFPIDIIILDMPEDIKVSLILERSFLSTAHAKIDVYKRKITLRIREERIIFISVKHTSSLIKRVYMPSLREIMELDLEARLMGDTLVFNRSLDHIFEDYIELNDLKKPIKHRRNQEVGINARRFDGMITIYNGNDEVTYQIEQSHPRFKQHTNKQGNKISPLLKVSEEDKMNGISHSYQKLKGFYNEVLNLGPGYIRDAKMEEWLTRGHISVHEMEW